MPTILIIGASRGLGLEFTRQYTAGGDAVWATARGEQGLQRVRALGAQRDHTERHTRRRRVGADDSDRRAALRYCDPLRRCRRCVVRRGHPLTTLRDTGWESLADYPLVLPPASTYTRVAIDSFMAEHHVALPRRHLESVSTPTNGGVLQFTDSVGFLSRELARHFAALGVLSVLPLPLPNVVLRVGLIWMVDCHLNGAQRKVRQLLRDAVRELPRVVADTSPVVAGGPTTPVETRAADPGAPRDGTGKWH